MALVENFTPFAVDEYAGLDDEGAEFHVVVVKATFALDASGGYAVAAAQPPVTVADVHTGEPEASGIAYPSDLVPHKPRVDVLVCGSIVLPTEVGQADVTLEVGARLRKTVRVFGDRTYVAGPVSEAVPSAPRPFREMPVAWERSFGGADPAQPDVFERANPVGRGLRKRAADLIGTPAPNFESKAHPLASGRDRPPPVGLGALAGHFWPRASFAGTYDRRWEEERFPLLPRDFDARYHNAAPADQQLEGGLGGDEVRLDHMTARGRERFTLPTLAIPLVVVERLGHTTAARLRPDTLLIEPAARRFSLIGRHRHLPRRDLLSLRAVLVGELPPGRRRALVRGKRYVDLRHAAAGG